MAVIQNVSSEGICDLYLRDRDWLAKSDIHSKSYRCKLIKQSRLLQFDLDLSCPCHEYPNKGPLKQHYNLSSNAWIIAKNINNIYTTPIVASYFVFLRRRKTKLTNQFVVYHLQIWVIDLFTEEINFE